MITICAIDDDRMLLEGMRAWLSPRDDVRLVGVFTTVAGFDQWLEVGNTPPQVVLLDLNLRDQSRPADNVRRVVTSGASVLIVSTIPDPDAVLATIEAGASGYLTKDQDLDVLCEAVVDVSEGRPAVSPELAFVFSRDQRPTRPQLSPQELTVLTAYASGATMAAAARKAGVAYGTAREYLERVKRKYSEAGRPTYTKLDLANRVREDRWELHGLD